MRATSEKASTQPHTHPPTPSTAGSDSRAPGGAGEGRRRREKLCGKERKGKERKRKEARGGGRGSSTHPPTHPHAPPRPHKTQPKRPYKARPPSLNNVSQHVSIRLPLHPLLPGVSPSTHPPTQPTQPNPAHPHTHTHTHPTNSTKPLQLWDKALINGSLKRVPDDDVSSGVLELLGRVGGWVGG